MRAKLDKGVLKIIQVHAGNQTRSLPLGGVEVDFLNLIGSINMQLTRDTGKTNRHTGIKDRYITTYAREK